MNSLINFALMTATSISLASATNNVKTESNQGQYVDDMRLVYANSESEAISKLKDGYELVGDGALYNNNDGNGNTYLAFKRTDDINNAITDIRAMNMYGGWSTSSYEAVLNELNENIKGYIASIKPSIDEFREKYILAKEKYEKEGIVTGTYYASTLIDAFYYDDIINPKTSLPYTILDVFTNDELYNDTNLITIFLEGNSDSILAIESALAFSTCSFVKEGEKCFYLDEFEEYECIEDCEECDYDSPINKIEMEQMVECISSLKETLTPYVKSGFADKNTTLSEDDYYSYMKNLIDDELLEFYTASKIYPLLEIVKFLDYTLADFIMNFNPDDNEFDINVVKPFILALSPAQRAIVPYSGLEALFTAKLGECTELEYENGEIKSFYESINEIIVHDLNLIGNGKCSVFANVNRKIYQADNIALTSAAERQNAAKGDFDFFENKDCSWIESKVLFTVSFATSITSFALGISCIIEYKISVKDVDSLLYDFYISDDFCYPECGALGEKEISIEEYFIIVSKKNDERFFPVFKEEGIYVQSIVRDLHNVDTIRGNDVNFFAHKYDLAANGKKGKIVIGEKMISKIDRTKVNLTNSLKEIGFLKFLKISIGIQIFVCAGALVLLFLNINERSKDKKTYATIPDMMFEETTIDGEVAYISYDVMKDFNDKNIDVIQAEKRKQDEWVSLYFTKDYNAGNPILADSFECTNKINGESEYLRKFGESGSCSLTKYTSSKNNGYAYLIYSSLDTLTIMKEEALYHLENYAYSIMNSLLGNSKVIYDTYREKINSCGNISDVEDTFIEAMNALNEEKVKNYEFAYPVYDFINNLENSTDLNSDIVLARTSYEELTSPQKEYIENIDILINLENEHEKEAIEVYKSTYLSEIKTYINSLDAFSNKEKEELFNSAQNEIYNAQTQNELNYAKSNCYSNIDNALKDKEYQAASSFFGNGNLGLLFLGLGGGLILGAAGLYVTLKFLKNRKKEEKE